MCGRDWPKGQGVARIVEAEPVRDCAREFRPRCTAAAAASRLVLPGVTGAAPCGRLRTAWG